MSVEILDKAACVGCYACYNVCNKQCISMVADKEGFMFPYINNKDCNKCNQCVKVCPVYSPMAGGNDYNIPKIFAAWSNDKEVRFNSTSGGIFTELASQVLEKGGYVSGAEYGKEFQIQHSIIHSKSELKKIRQSKYAQSHIGLIYSKIKELIRNNQLVLFCGTPCQCEALLKYLGNNRKNLILVDFICRGVNSPKAYKKFLEWLSNKYNQKIKNVWFKNKTYGWNRFSTKVEFENCSAYIEDRDNDYFMKGYIGGYNLYMRQSCEKCLFKKIPHVSDITLGDFWGVKMNNPLINIENGTSLVMINSYRGEKLFETISDKIYREEKELKDVYQGNPYLLKSPKYHKRRRSYFFKHLDMIPFDELIRRCTKKTIIKRAKDIISKFLKLIFNL